ncbi:hypothetical protein PV325_002895 [Microctonus aethiopoides]|nr:hypothetical protein PV325_002895 [Microctonus aethiopoides]
MQSKVFWSHMAAQDFDNAPLLRSNSCNSTSKIHQNSYCNLGRDSDTDDNDRSINNSPNRSIVDVTTINAIGHKDRIININNNVDIITEDCVQQQSSRIQCDKWNESNQNAKEYNEESVDLTKIKNPIPIIKRSFSPLEQGHGSLDSGFSDSEHSREGQSAGNIDNISTRRRRRRRKRSRDRRDSIGMNFHHSRLNLIWMENELTSTPSHTSTPKRNIPEFKERHNSQYNENLVLGNINKDAHSNQRIEEEQNEASVVLAPVFIRKSADEECLDDFLYTNEPPEDDDVPSTSSSSTSRDSTPSFNGPWYSRISTESSSKSTSISIEKNHRMIFKEQIYSSVKMWLKDLIQDTEYESCVTLQSKALPKRKRLCEMNEEEQSKDLKMMTAKATAAATELLVRADSFTKNIQNVIAKISHVENGRSQRELLRCIEEEAFSILSELGAPPPRRIHDGSLRCILNQIESLNNMVNCNLNARLDFYIERVVRGLEDAPRESGSVARGALAALTALGLAGSRAGNSIARCSGVRTLLTSLVSASRLSSELRASTLRALTSVCCCPLAINYFVKDGGPEILMDLLTSKRTPESEKMEATALVVQITAPWTDALGLSHLEPFGNILIDVLTHLAEETKCGQTLLLCGAALNNLADSKTCMEAIVQCDSVRRLLRCVKKSPGANIWLMEQVVLLINKLAKSFEGRKHLAKAKASVALVSFLRMTPPGLEETYQRLSIAAATALTRLCVDEEIAKQVVAVGGADCLPNHHLHDDNEDIDEQLGILKYSKSLRIACKRAAKRIDDAKACDYAI